MKNYLKILIVFSFLLFSPAAFSQRITHFSEDSQTFLKELGTFFGTVSHKGNKKKCEALMEKFTEYWNTGTYNKEFKDSIKVMCNLLLKRRLRPYPHFYNYISSMNGIMESDHPTDSYNEWYKTLSILANDKRSIKHVTTYLELSNNLINNLTLYESKGVAWKTDTYDFTFKYDSVPEVDFPMFTLKCYANKDSSVIFNTKGSYYPLKNRWIGVNGKIDWTRAGFDADTVYAILGKYEIYMGFSRFHADSVTFYHKKYWKNSLLGSLDEKVLSNVTPEKATYPRFSSYLKRVPIKSVFKNIDYVGGIEMQGSKLLGAGDKYNDAILTIKKGKKDFVEIRSKSFVIRPHRISSILSSVSIRYKEDSIYHAGIQMNYVDANKELALVRSGEGLSKSPFYDSFHNLDIYTEAVYWNMKDSIMDFRAVKGSTGLSRAVFESSNYFSAGRYEKLQGIDMINPLNAIQGYCKKNNTREIYLEDLSYYMRIPQEQLIGMLVNLSNKGFVIYNPSEKKAFVKDKLFDYIKAMAKKIDYDVIQFNSETYNLKNAALELDSFALRLYGVPFVFLSDSQNVFIYPDNRQLLIKQGMDFKFTGRVHAGLFDFFANQCEFNYEQFKLDMPSIDSMRFMVHSFEPDEYGKHPLVAVKSVIADLGGDLIIDDANNKSGLKNFPQYPLFHSTKDSYVYYDKPEIFNGIYDREKFFFYLYPFDIDSLDNFKTEMLEFKGYLASAGIFPDMEQTLKVQEDYSLGFKAKTPPEGLAAYEKGTFFSDLQLSNKGLRGNGSLQYLTSTSWSDDYIFFPDSCNANAKTFVVNEQLTPIEYPAVKGVDVFIHWVPYKDFMVVTPHDIPMDMFGGQSKLYGDFILTPEQSMGKGRISFEDAEMQSNLYKFKQHEIFADTADFNLTSQEFLTSTFTTHNYNSHIDFNERNGQFVSNGGLSLVEFPVNMYVCLIDEFSWFMDSYEIAMGSAEKEAEMVKYNDMSIRELIDVPLVGSEFISTHPSQDSLRFISTIATYSLKDYIIHAEDVKYIRVADAAIFPSDHKITIFKDAKMDTLSNVKILANTVTRYHEIYDAAVDIKSRNSYTGTGNYDYVDETGYRQKILFKNIRVDQTYQTIASGHVSASTGFSISNDFDFSGNVNLMANNQFLNFDGGFRIRHTCSAGQRSWVKFNSPINPKDIYIEISDNLTNLEGEKLEAALLFSPEINRFYSGFLKPKRSKSDQVVISASGYIRFDKKKEAYIIGSKEKLKGQTLEGNQLILERKQCVLTCDGILNLGVDLGMVDLTTYGTVVQYIIPDSTTFDVVMTLDFPFDKKALDMLVENTNGKNLQGVNVRRPILLKAYTDMLGEKKADKIVSDINLFGKLRKYPSELQHTIVFSDLKLKWNYATRSYISRGAIGVGGINDQKINKLFNGYVEVAKKRTGDVVNIYLEFDRSKYWYYFNYRNNMLQTISSNTEYNNLIRDTKDDKRTFKGDKEGSEYRYIISNLRKKTDFLRRITNAF